MLGEKGAVCMQNPLGLCVYSFVSPFGTPSHASGAQTYQRTLLAGKAAAAPLLAPAVAALVGAWEAARAPAAADALGTAAEVFGAEPGRASLLAGALERVCAAAAADGGVRAGPAAALQLTRRVQPAARGRLACFQGERCCAAVLAAGGRSRRGGRGGGRSEATGRKRQGALLRERPEAAAALLGLLDRCMLLAPGALAAARALPAGLRLALAAAGGRETDPARAGLSLLGHALVSARGALAPQARHALAHWRGLCCPASVASGVAHARSVRPVACGEAGLARAARARRRQARPLALQARLLSARGAVISLAGSKIGGNSAPVADGVSCTMLSRASAQRPAPAWAAQAVPQ